MNKRIFLILALVAGISCISGCGQDEAIDQQIPETKVIIEDTNSSVTTDRTENTANDVTDGTSVGNTTSPKTNDASLSLSDLSQVQFTFCSGAGGWTDDFSIFPDGYFMGNFVDSNMGETGEDYANGTVYCCDYTGHFSEPVKIDDLTYEITLKDISYSKEVGEEELVWLEDLRYVYTGAYALGGNKSFRIYMPGTPLAGFNEEIQSWFYGYGIEGTKLENMIMVDEDNKYVISGYPKMEPSEDARITYNSYKQSVEYLMGLDGSTRAIDQARGMAYTNADKCLNYIWTVMKYSVSEDEFKKILEEQRTWLKDRDKRAEEASSEWEGGSFQGVIYTESMVESTMERCEVLLGYIK
ncbi:MAG: DUF1311 domain-containing protein [Pseudobutyrivibrio sp.]|nr:DUF1311 domain-containing protein [Pseudobutyrivibrio sp.]